MDDFVAVWDIVGGQMKLIGPDLDSLMENICDRLKTNCGDFKGVFQGDQVVHTPEEARQACADAIRT